MSLKRRHQIFAAREEQAGQVVSGLLAAANGDYLVIDPTIVFEPELFERANINRESLSPLQPLAGITPGSAAFQIEMAGRTDATVPAWGLLMEACGFKQVTTERIVTNSSGISGGPLYHGETITQTGTGATAVVVHDTYSAAAVQNVIVETISGAENNSGLWTGGTSTATFTPTAVGAADGFAWYPTSTELLQFTGTPDTTPMAAGTVLKGDTSEAVAVIHTATSGTGSQTVTVRVLDGIFQASETLSDVASAANIVLPSSPAFTMSQVPSISLGLIEDARSKVLTGCRGSWGISGAIGEAAIMSFDPFRGIKSSIVDAGAIPGVTYNATVPPVILGVTFAVGDDSDTTQALEASPRLQSFSFSHGSTIGIPRDAGETTGLYDSAHQTARATEGSLTVNIGPEATFAWLAALTAGSAVHTRLSIGSGTDLFQLTAPGMVASGESGGEAEGIANTELSFRLGSRNPAGTDSADAELVLSYTNA